MENGVSNPFSSLVTREYEKCYQNQSHGAESCHFGKSTGSIERHSD